MLDTVDSKKRPRPERFDFTKPNPKKDRCPVCNNVP